MKRPDLRIQQWFHVSFLFLRLIFLKLLDLFWPFQDICFISAHLVHTGHRVGVSLHQLLERDGLHVSCAGDLRMTEWRAQRSLTYPRTVAPHVTGLVTSTGGGHSRSHNTAHEIHQRDDWSLVVLTNSDRDVAAVTSRRVSVWPELLT